ERGYAQWHMYSTRLIEQRESGVAVNNVAVNMQGKEIMDSVRAARDELVRIEEQRLTDRIARVRRAIARIFITAVVLSLFLGLLLATFSRRELKTVAKTYDNVLGTAYQKT